MTPCLYAVVGNPILHSKSPEMHNEVLHASGSTYIRIHGEKFSDIISLSRELSLKGINVTAPFKEDAYAACSQVSEEAKELSVVNTLVFNDDEIFGVNTDVHGVRASLKSAHAFSDSLSYLVIGAGGAAKSALCALKGKKVTLTNRSTERGRESALEWGVSFIPLLEVSLEKFDVIISTVPDPTFLIPREKFAPRHIFLNALYKESAMSLNARSSGCTIIPGEEWLLHQAEEAAQFFYGKGEYIHQFQHGLLNAKKKKNSLAFIGMMGAGKSEIAKSFSRRSGFLLCDLDKKIEETTGRAIPDIFLDDGEASFREIESKCLHKLSLREPTVLATGGGAVLDPRNRAFLRENFTTVWLYASEEVLLKRLSSQMDTRPVLKTGSVANILAQRKLLYAETSDIVFLTDGYDIESLSEMIYREWL